MKAILIAAIPAFALLAGCGGEQSQLVATAPTAASAPGSSEMVYVRVDGKRLSTHPQLADQLQLDQTICRGEAERAGMTAKNTIETPKPNFAVSIVNAGIKMGQISDVMKGCMAQHGYMYMSVADAERRADSLEAGSTKKKKRRA